MAIIIGSARSDERGKYSGGKPGDQKQTNGTNDTKGEVSMQNMYKHKKGWYIIRPVSVELANKIAERCRAACNNKNIGYGQSDRYGIIKNGIDTKIPTNADCSSLVREIVKEAAGIDPGDFTTDGAQKTLLKMKDKKSNKLFSGVGEYISQDKTPLYVGDFIVTLVKGHIATVVGGNQRSSDNGYYPVYKGKSNSIVDALVAVGEIDTSKLHRAMIAKANGITNYKYTDAQNRKMVSLIKKGKLKRA